MQLSKNGKKMKDDTLFAIPAPVAEELKPEPKIAKGKTKSVEAQIAIPPLEFTEFEVTMEGTAPYLVAGWTEKAIRMMEDAMTKHVPKPAKGMREKRDPETEFEAYKVKNAKGKESIPALHIKCAMVNAGIRSTTGVYKADLRAAIFVMGDEDGLIPFEYKKCVMRRDMVRNKSGQPDIRWRPEYHGWKARVRLRVNNALITVESAVNLLARAGSMVGLGEWRIEKGGQHGTWKIATKAQKGLT